MNLQYLFTIVELERPKIAGDESPAFFPSLRLFRQMDCHGRTENSQPLVEANDFLFVQPQQGAFEQFLKIRALRFQCQIGLKNTVQSAKRCLRK